MERTENLGLHQWDADDAFLREEFNENFGRIDAGVGEKCRMAWGTYVGNSQSAVDSANSQRIPLPFTPRVVMVYHQSSISNAGSPYTLYYSGMAMEGVPFEAQGSPILKLVENGFEVGSVRIGVSDQSPKLNEKSRVYLYLALR